jgi:hypothetical protein
MVLPSPPPPKTNKIISNIVAHLQTANLYDGFYYDCTQNTHNCKLFFSKEKQPIQGKQGFGIGKVILKIKSRFRLSLNPLDQYPNPILHCGTLFEHLHHLPIHQ